MSAVYHRVTVTIQAFPMSNNMTVLNSIDQMETTVATIDLLDDADSTTVVAEKIVAWMPEAFHVVANHPLEEIKKKKK